MVFINKNKIKLIALAVAVVLGLTTSIILGVRQIKEAKQNNSITKNVEDKANSENNNLNNKNDENNETDKKETKTEYEKIIENTKYDSEGEIASDFTVDSKGGKLLDKSTGHNAIVQARNYICNADWNSAYNTVQDIVNEYNLDTEEGRTIEKIYYDTNIVRNLKNLDYDQYPQAFEGFLDPQDLLVAVLHIPEKSRRDIIINRQSLSPIFNGIVTLQGISGNSNKDEDMQKKLKDIQVDYFDAIQLIKIDFMVEGNPLEGYVVRDYDNKLKLYSIEPKEGTTSLYLTVQGYIDLDNKLYENSLIREAGAK